MNTTPDSVELLPRLRRQLLSVLILAFGALAFMALTTSTTPATANFGSDGGDNTGGGNCSYAGVHWRQVSSWSQVPRAGNSTCWNNGGSQGVAKAGQCDNHPSDMLRIWYLSSPDGQWATEPGSSLDVAQRANVISVINNSSFAVPNNKSLEDAKAVARQSVVDHSNIIICVWGEAVPDLTVYVDPTRPSSEAPSCRRPEGRIYIRDDGQGRDSTFETGSGQTLNKASWYVVGEPPLTGNFNIVQRLTGRNLEFTNNRGKRVAWNRSDFGNLSNAVGACEVRVQIQATECQTMPNTGYFTVTSSSDDQVRFWSSGTERFVGTQYPANDGSTVTVNVGNVPAGHSVLINGVETGSWTHTFRTCNADAVSASVRFSAPVPGWDCRTQTVIYNPRGSYTLNETQGVTWTITGNTNGDPGQSIRLVATAPNGKTFPASLNPAPGVMSGDRRTITWNHTWPSPAYTQDRGPCQTTPQPTTEQEVFTEDRTLTSTYCSNSNETRQVPSTTTSQEYPTTWITVISNGAAHPGPTQFEEQQDLETTPLGLLFAQKAAQNSRPTNAEIAAALAQMNSVPHAQVDLSPVNRDALAEGGVMNVREFTSNMRMNVTQTDYFNDTFQTCYTVSQDQRRTRVQTTTRTPNPTTYTVRRSDATTTAGTPAYTSYQVQTRDRDESSRVGRCGFENVNDTYNRWYEVRSATCDGGRKTMYWDGAYTPWSGWSNQTSSSRPGLCDQPLTTNEVRQVRNCVNHAATSGSTTWGPYNTTSTTATSCPSDTSTARYQCTANPTTYTTTVDPGTWSAWANNGPSRTSSPSTTSTGTTYTGSTFDTNFAHASQPLTAFWQTLSVKCNAGGAASAAARGSKIDQQVSGADHFSYVAVSPVVSSAGAVAWGPTSSNPVGTVDNGLYDKQCSYPGREVSPDTQASYKFFRDNELRPVSAALYEPISGGLITNDGDPASRTFLTRWVPGTPDPKGSTGGRLRGMTEDGQAIFSESTDAPPVVKQWASPQASSANGWAILTGEQTDFYFGATWATDRNKPNVLTTKWEYDPLVSARLPLEDVGFGPGGSRNFTLGSHAVEVQGQVYGAHDSQNTPAFPTLTAQSSGSGVSTNVIDSTLIEGTAVNGGGEWTMSPSLYSDLYRTVAFIRAVGS